MYVVYAKINGDAYIFHFCRVYDDLSIFAKFN